MSQKGSDIHHCALVGKTRARTLEEGLLCQEGRDLSFELATMGLCEFREDHRLWF